MNKFNNKKLISKNDIIIIIGVILLGIIMWFFTSKTNNSDIGIAVVEQNGVEIGRYNLAKQTETQKIAVGGDYNIVLLLEPNKISFYHSDCKDQICVHAGKISHPGQTAVCLPARVSIRIIGENGKYDVMTG